MYMTSLSTWAELEPHPHVSEPFSKADLFDNKESVLTPFVVLDKSVHVESLR